MNRRTLSLLMGTLLSLAMLAATPLVRAAADEAPDALIKRISVDVLDNIKADKSVQSGDMSRVISLVDTKIMPNVDFTRMTASAVGRNWRQATPEQQKRLQEEFKTLQPPLTHLPPFPSVLSPCTYPFSIHWAM